MDDECSSAWRSWRDQLTDDLLSLGEGEFLNTWGPARTRDGGRDRGTGWFGRSKPPEVVSAPVVRVLRTEDLLLVESVPAFPGRGEPELSDERRSRLRAAGWLAPGDEGYVPVGGPDLRVYVPARDAAQVADLAVETYRILGVEDPAVLTVERSH